MPKKRHQARYSRPQSTAPPSLSSSSSLSSVPRHTNNSQNNTQPRTVNSLLASLRTSHASPSPQHDGRADHHRQQRHPPDASSQAGSMPPVIRQILQLPESAPPRPRRQPRIGPNGRRLPPGPPPPASWVSGAPGSNDSRDPAVPDAAISRLLPASTEAEHRAFYGALFPRLPGTHKLNPRSLVAAVLREMARTWSFQRSFNRYYLYSLPGSLRSGLIATLCRHHHMGGVTVADLRVLLTVPDFPTSSHGDDGSHGWDGDTSVNDDFFELDLSGCLGHTMTLRELSTFLFGSSSSSSRATSDSGTTDARGKGKGKGRAAPDAAAAPSMEEEIHESWETYSLSPSPPALATTLSTTLPYLTHLSLALRPTWAFGGGEQPTSSSKRYNVSWKQLLSMAPKLSSLTHLSLANWPTPVLTSASVSIPWPDFPTADPVAQTPQSVEAVLVLRKLSKALYGLQYLDLTGCNEWWDVLRHLIKPSACDLPGQESFMAEPPARGRRRQPELLIESPPPMPPVSGEGGVSRESQEAASCDGIDWVGDWGKVETVVMKSCGPGLPAGVGPTHDRRVGITTARMVESYIRTQRLGRGKWFSVEKDDLPKSKPALGARR